jgi:hypothetical protein
MTNLWLVGDLLHHTYPFSVPDLFRRKMSKDKFDVTFEVIKIYGSVNIEKEFYIKKFLSTYRISNQRITNMKLTFIKLVNLFEAYDLIEPYYKVCHDHHYYVVQKLDVHNISEGFILYEKLSI